MAKPPVDFEPSRIDKLFGQMAVSRHFVAPHHVRECMTEFARRAKRNKKLRFADVLVKRGYITKSQRETIEGLVEKELGPDSVGRYELVQKIGEGGMGTVYKARDSSSGRVVALKVLPAKLAEDRVFMGRFQREAIAVTQLDHPNIVRGLDVGVADGSHYIAMEFIDGLDCDKMLARRGRIPEKEAAQIGAQVASALSYAQTKRLVHRDIKPANILVVKDGTAKLTDLGLAKSTSATAAKLTQAGITMGTPHYISPEQAMGSSDLDTRSDMYSLGATLYQLVTGRVPFEGSSPAIIVAKHLTEELENPKDLVPELSEGMTLVLEKMLAKDREDRYRDPGELVRDLEKVAEGRRPSLEALAAGRSSIMKSAEIREAADRLAKKRRARLRRRGPVALVVGVALGLGIAITVVVLILTMDVGDVDDLSKKLKDARDAVKDKIAPIRSVPKEEWKKLFDGKSFAGWQSSGPREWRAKEGSIESGDTGVGRLETVSVHRDYQLRAEFRASYGTRAWIVLGKPPGAEGGGARVRLQSRGQNRWVQIEATVKGSKITVMVDGKPPALELTAASEEGVIAFEAKSGTLSIRLVRFLPLPKEPAGGPAKEPAKTPAPGAAKKPSSN
ncbi:MAG: protein kinase domain-containing protein [Planctomycetota bacterium]|jgi:serine/threonine-protein kinase